MQHTFFLLSILLFTLTYCQSPEATQNDESQKPWEVHGKLTISENRHYIQHEDGTPFLWLGGTAWGITEWLSREDVDVYLDDRQEKGFNIIQLCLLWGKRHDDPVRFPVNPENAYGKRALSYTDSIPDPARPDTVAGGSSTAPNDYWDHVDYVVEAAAERDMYVGLLPVWGRRYVNATHAGHSQSLFNEENAFTYGQFLGQRYRNVPNIVWILGGDVKALAGGDFRNVYRAMAEGIIRGITNENIQWDQPHLAWDAAFMTYHPDGAPHINSSDWFHKDAWLDFNMIETHIHRDALYETVLHDYHLMNPVKPTVMGEGHYEGYTHDNLAGPIHIRRQAYQTFFAGGAGHTYGAFRDSLDNGPLFSPFKGWQNLLDLEGAQSFAHLKKFLTAHQWWQWQPDTTLIIGGKGEDELAKVAVKSTENEEILVYYPENTSCEINLNTVFNTEKVSIEWFNPKDGNEIQAEGISSDDALNPQPPANWEDAVLIIRK